MLFEHGYVYDVRVQYTNNIICGYVHLIVILAQRIKRKGTNFFLLIDIYGMET